MTVHAGTRLGPYEIVAPLGAGGMGEVWRARDTRLGRDVAIKVLPADVEAEPDRLARFEREARAVAALSHPNILALYDVGTASFATDAGTPGPRTVHYLVTELLEGRTLAERIRAGDLTAAKATELAGQLARGLAAAHERGVVHRDLKPANVVVTSDGVVKILDFGLARLTHVEGGAWDPATAPTAASMTEAGSVVGTVGYMAPEQVRGLPADHRSDIFAFGCVLHEMLCGTPPFRRGTAADTSVAILRDQPPALADAVKGLPPRLEAIVGRCLEKSPEDRFQSARDLAHDLDAVASAARPARQAAARPPGRRWRVVAPALAALVAVGVGAALVLRPGGSEKKVGAPTPPRIVVLPFENLGLPEDAYFAAGMAEEITSRLANVRGLRVISRTTAVGYDRKGKTVREIGEDLGVDYVLEGSVRWEHGQEAAGRVRITPQLIRVSDDTHVWAERYDRVLAGVFAIQSEVAVSAVEAMDIALLPREQTALSEVSTDDLVAYDQFLRGRESLDGGEDRPHIEGAVGMFQAAVDRDPRFARALAGLARAHLFMYWLYYDRSEERLAGAKVAAERAVALRPDLADTHVALGYYFYHGLLDYPRALDELAAARKIQPNNGDAIAGTGYVLRRQGRWAEAADAIGEAVELDPKNAVLLSNLGEATMLAGRYPEAARAFGLARALSPTWATPYGLGAWVEVHSRGDLAAAQAILDQAAAVPGFTDDGSVAWASFLFDVFRRDYQGALRRLEAGNRRPGEAFLDPMPTALMRGQVERLAGLTDAARRSFDAARRELEPMVEKVPYDPRFHGWLGLAYAGLGRADDAVREARAACDLLVAAQDAFKAVTAFENVAVVLVMTGRNDEAIAALRDLQARSGAWWVHPLRLSPVWDPLRGDPRFQALL